MVHIPLLDEVTRLQLTKNYESNRVRIEEGLDELDFVPVVKLFAGSSCTWLLTELDSDNIAFGLCDLGLGFPELGYVAIQEIEELRDHLGLPVERDLYFRPTLTLSQYAEQAHRLGRINA